MTLDEALTKAAADLDVVREEARLRFEQSLIDNRAADNLTAEEIDELRDYERDYMQAWREASLAMVREKLLEPWDTVH
jgi:hypothetical protein